MKRNKLMNTGFLSILILLAVSCEKLGKPSIIGQWEVIKLEVFVLSGEELVSQGSYEPEIHIMEFRDDGTLKIYYNPDDLTDYADFTWSHTTDPIEEGDHIMVDGDDLIIESLTDRTLMFAFWESSTDKLVFTLKKVD